MKSENSDRPRRPKDKFYKVCKSIVVTEWVDFCANLILQFVVTTLLDESPFLPADPASGLPLYICGGKNVPSLR